MEISENQKHTPVLLSEVLDLLKPNVGDSYLDLTAGYGGHAEAVIGKIGDSGSAIMVDRDQTAIDFLKQKFSAKSNVSFMHEDFYTASKKLLAKGKKFDVILADLGVSSVHLDNPERGFSFAKTGPLDMRMDVREEVSASKVVNEYSLEQLADVLKKYGDIRGATKIAEFIIENRPYESTTELAERISQLIKRRKRTHPATEIFQAIRIEVNRELELIEKSLPIWLELLNTNGRIGVISFQSLEDKLVKQCFKDNGGKWYDAKLQIVTKQPVTGSDEEVVFNPRARSAKLRVAQRK